MGARCDHRHSRLHARRRERAVRAHRGARDCVGRPVPDLRHRTARGSAGCGADQWHRLTRAGFRRLQRHTGRASICADPACTVRPRGNTHGRRPGVHRRLCRGLGDRDAHRPRRQFPSLREGLAPDGNARRVRFDRCVLPPAGTDAGGNGDGAGTGGIVRIRGQGELRHHDQAAACRTLLTQRNAGSAACRGRVHRQRGRAGAQAGLPARVQRRRAISTPTRSCATGVSRGTSCSRVWRSSSIRAAAARIRRSMRC